MIAYGVDLGGEPPLSCDNKLNLSALQRKHFLCRLVEDYELFGYLFMPPYEELNQCIFLSCEFFPSLSEVIPSFNPPRST